MKTSTESLIDQLKNAGKSNALLVPKIEQFMKVPLEFAKGDDIWLAELLKTRAEPRTGGLFSPSQLSSCVRQSYFKKTKEIPAKPSFRIESSGFFLDGDFRHFKWQYVMYKMAQEGIIELLGTEVRVINKQKDFGGAIDNIIKVDGLTAIVDWKGMNTHSFMNTVGQGPPSSYITQITAYALLVNEVLGMDIDTMLIVCENKNGPQQVAKMPLGLLELRFDPSIEADRVRSRLKRLRALERRREIPEAECVSTHRMQFTSCPFQDYCLPEVKAIENSNKNNDKKLKFAKPQPRG